MGESSVTLMVSTTPRETSAMPPLTGRAQSKSKPKRSVGRLFNLLGRYDRPHITQSDKPAPAHSLKRAMSSSSLGTQSQRANTYLAAPAPSSACGSSASSDKIPPPSRSSSFATAQSKPSFATAPSKPDEKAIPPRALPHDQSFWDIIDEPKCPLCQESLSLRLRREKFTVPKCGHAVHHQCFTTMYGDPKDVFARQQHQKRYGIHGKHTYGSDHPEEPVCHVCRKSFELTTDRPTHLEAGRRPGLPAKMANRGDSASSRRVNDRLRDKDLNGDDRADPFRGQGPMIKPILSIEAEHPVLCRRDSAQDGKQTISALVKIAVPGRPPAEEYPRTQRNPSIRSEVSSMAPLSPSSNDSPYSSLFSSRYRPRKGTHRQSFQSPTSTEFPATAAGVDASTDVALDQHRRQSKALYDLPEEKEAACRTVSSQQRIRDSTCTSTDKQTEISLAASQESIPIAAPVLTGEEVRKQVKENLEASLDGTDRDLDQYGELHLCDSLHVVQHQSVRRFLVYIFEQAILCTADEGSQTTPSKYPFDRSSCNPIDTDPAATGNATLKLKGRIYFRHIKHVTNTSTPRQASVSIQMIDEKLGSCALAFDHEDQASIWKEQMDSLVLAARYPGRGCYPTPPYDLKGTTIGLLRPFPIPPGLDISKPAASAPEESTYSALDNSRRQSCVSHPTSHRSVTSTALSTTLPWSPAQTEFGRDCCTSIHPVRTNSSARYDIWKTDSRRSCPHAAVDLVIMVAVPKSSRLERNASQDVFMLGLIRSTLHSLAGSLGDQDRISIVAFCPGLRSRGAFIAKVHLLRIGIESSRGTLMDFLDVLANEALDTSIAYAEDSSQYAGSGANPDRIDSTSALNVGLDVMLQRGSKNPVAAMLLIDDSFLRPRRASMDLILSRSSVAGVPIHCFGLGLNHDPSSMWVVANHTGGGYTFLRSSAELREAAAGWIGSLLSVALTDVTVRIALPQDNKMRIRHAVGSSNTVVSSDGKHVDVDLGMMHYRGAREILLDLEYKFPELYASLGHYEPSLPSAAGANPLRCPVQEQQNPSSRLYPSDNVLAQFGFDESLLNFDPLSTTAQNPSENIPFAASFVDEVVVLEADAAFCDPTTLQGATRLESGPRRLVMDVNGSDADFMAGLPPATLAALAHPDVTRRRFELLANEMISRSLLLASQLLNLPHAYRLLQETRRIMESVLAATPGYTPLEPVPSPKPKREKRTSSLVTKESTPSAGWQSEDAGGTRSDQQTTSVVPTNPGPPPSSVCRPTSAASAAPMGPTVPKQPGHKATIESLSAIIQDLDFLLGLLVQDLTTASKGPGPSTPATLPHMSRATAMLSTLSLATSSSSSSSTSGKQSMPRGTYFEREGKKVGAQQAMILRNQKAWTKRTATEQLRFGDDNWPAGTTLTWSNPTPFLPPDDESAPFGMHI